MWKPYAAKETVHVGVHNVSLQFGHHIHPKSPSLRVPTMSLWNVDTILSQRDSSYGCPQCLFAMWTPSEYEVLCGMFINLWLVLDVLGSVSVPNKEIINYIFITRYLYHLVPAVLV